MSAVNPAFLAIVRSRVGKLCLLFCVELLVLAILYQFFADIECYKLQQWGTCSFLRSLVARAMILLAVTLLLIWSWPAEFRRFALASDQHSDLAVPRALHFVGLALLFVPLAMSWGQDLGAMFATAFWPWMIGAILAAGGGVAWMAPRSAWWALLAQDRFAMVPILLIAFVLPDIADQLRPLWDWSVLITTTFSAVAAILHLFSEEVFTDVATFTIGIPTLSGGFVVQIGQPCSGVEGFALVSAFVAIYAYIFRKDLRFPLYWFVVLPLGLLLSWCLNVVRIAGLILIGAHISPNLAVDGFHSYAGWLFFTLLALALVWAVQMTPWLYKSGAVPRADVPLRQDLVAASLLPFVALMLISTILSAFLTQPELGYPAKAVVMAAALWFFRLALRRLPWAWDTTAFALGAVAGLGWVLTSTQSDPDLAATLQTWPVVGRGVWVAFRLVGTVLLIPVIEELFFRGYVLARLDGPQPWRRVLAVVVSSAAFAALHGRWVEAGLAGVIFAVVMLRRGRVTDAILAHVTANLVVAVFALAKGDFSLI